ncbi:hypothetical protein Tco_1554410 [Tanacetum coccineum]
MPTTGFLGNYINSILSTMGRLLKHHREKSPNSLFQEAKAIVGQIEYDLLPICFHAVAELKDMVRALLLDKKNQSQVLATVKAF